MKKKIWIEELRKGTYDRGSVKKMMENLRESIGYVWPEKRGKKIVWTTPVLSGGYFTSGSQELAEVVAQNETIIALLLRSSEMRKVKK